MHDAQRRERERLDFIARRDGREAAADFAQRTYRQYREALQSGYGRAYRDELVHSCVVFRRFVRGGAG